MQLWTLFSGSYIVKKLTQCEISQSALTVAFSAYTNADCICTTVCQEFGLRKLCVKWGSTNTNWHIDVHYVKIFSHIHFNYFAIFVLHSFCLPIACSAKQNLFKSNSTLPTSVRLYETAMITPSLCFMIV